MTRRPFVVVAVAFFALLVGVNLATPLYAVYRVRFGFSIALLPVIFAVYAVMLVPSLLAFGQLSDRLGRRRVIAAGLGLALLALLLFAFAQGTAWLFAARALQGIAVGTASGALTAALVELEPRHDRRRAALLATLAQAGGSAAGPLLAGMLAQWAPWPRTLCFLLGAGATGVAALAVLTIPEPVAAGAQRWRIQRPRIPREIRAEFARAGLTAGMVWAVAALFLSVAPTYTGRLLRTHNLALLGAISALMLGASCVAQLASKRSSSPRGAQAGGLALLACGLGALVLAFPLHSLTLVLVGALLAGVGHGVAFLGAQADVNRIAPPHARGEVTAAFYACIYLCVAVPVIGVGLLALSLSLFAAVGVFAAVIGGTALATAAWHLAGGGRPELASS
jgi:predicted MFS family arabinose efflux permease